MGKLPVFKVKFTDRSKPIHHPKRHRSAIIRALDEVEATRKTERIYKRIKDILIERISKK